MSLSGSYCGKYCPGGDDLQHTHIESTVDQTDHSLPHFMVHEAYSNIGLISGQNMHMADFTMPL